MLGIGTVAAFLSPVLWSLTDGNYALEKVFQKTALLLLLLSAIFARTKSSFTSTPDRISPDIRVDLKRLIIGWLTGIVILLIPLYLLILLKIRILDSDALSLTNITHRATSAFGVGLIIGCIEEYIFRGWLLEWLLARLDKIQSIARSLTIIASAFYFAILHFLKPQITPYPHSNTLTAGLDVLLRSLEHLFQHHDFDTLLALFLAGVFLALIKIRYNKGLMLVIGIHAGWVFSIKMTRALTDLNPSSQWRFLAGQDGITGYLSASWLGLIVIGVILLDHSIKKPHH